MNPGNPGNPGSTGAFFFAWAGIAKAGYAGAILFFVGLGVFPVEASAQDARTVVIVASDYSAVKGVQPSIQALTSGGELVGFSCFGKNYSLRDLDSNGVALWTVRALGSDYRVFKLKRGWPASPISTEENPRMDPASAKIGPEGGNLTLTYLEEGGLFSNDYRHLRMRIECVAAGRCQLLTFDGRPFDRVFAFASENRRGIREVRPVTRSEFARLTGEIMTDSAPRVSSLSDKPVREAAYQASSPSSEEGASSVAGAAH